MTSKSTNAQVDRLGERLKAGETTSADLQLLDEYRRCIAEPFAEVDLEIRARLQLEPAWRPAKSTASIVEKLKRESIRLSQMQDIAGCRLVVDGLHEQEDLIESLKLAFTAHTVVDRRLVPSHGYRAGHVIIRICGRPMEIQVRTRLQHMWSELSEKLADVFDPAVKYGGGPELIRDLLAGSSQLVAKAESAHLQLLELLALSASDAELPGDLPQQIERLRDAHDSLDRRTVQYFGNFIAQIEAQKGNVTCSS